MIACGFIITVFYMKTFFCGHNLKIREKLFRCCHLGVLNWVWRAKTKQLWNHKLNLQNNLDVDKDLKWLTETFKLTSKVFTEVKYKGRFPKGLELFIALWWPILDCRFNGIHLLYSLWVRFGDNTKNTCYHMCVKTFATMTNFLHISSLCIVSPLSVSLSDATVKV